MDLKTFFKEFMLNLNFLVHGLQDVININK